MLQIRDVYPGPGFFHLGSVIRNTELTKNWSILAIKLVTKLSEIWSEIDVYSGSGFFSSRIQGSKKQRFPDPQHCFFPCRRLSASCELIAPFSFSGVFPIAGIFPVAGVIPVAGVFSLPTSFPLPASSLLPASFPSPASFLCRRLSRCRRLFRKLCARYTLPLFFFWKERREWLGKSQFRRLEKKLSTLPSLWLQETRMRDHGAGRWWNGRQWSVSASPGFPRLHSRVTLAILLVIVLSNAAPAPSHWFIGASSTIKEELIVHAFLYNTCSFFP